MDSLTLRLYFIIGLLFGLIYLTVVLVGEAMGAGSFQLYLIFAGVIVLVQYLISPKIVEWTMRVQYLKAGEYPDLQKIVAELAQRAGVPVPRIAISELPVPNAFAFGRSRRDGRVCVTRGIINLLSKEELTAVIGHEIAHIKNRDMMVMTFVSVIPMIMFMLSRSLMFSGMFGGRSRNNNGGAVVLLGLFFLLVYFVSNLLVLAISRIREYKADEGSVGQGNKPEHLASALYKLVYGSAKLNPQQVQTVAGAKAFFINDPSQARNEIRELAQLDMDKSGTIDRNELDTLCSSKIKMGVGGHLMELLTTHPNMLKRIKRLAELRA